MGYISGIKATQGKGVGSMHSTVATTIKEPSFGQAKQTRAPKTHYLAAGHTIVGILILVEAV